MSLEAMHWAFNQQDTTPSEKVLLLALADHSAPDGECWPSIPLLMKKTSLSERAVFNNLKSLSKRGVIRREKGHHKSITTFLNFDYTPAPDAPCTKCTPALNAPQRVQEMQSRGAGDAPKPSYNHQLEPSVKEKNSKKENSSSSKSKSEIQICSPPKVKRATRLSEDWELPDEGITFAEDLGLNVPMTFGAFRDHWLSKAGKDACKLDWLATWRNWCRKKVEWQTTSVQTTKKPPVQASFGVNVAQGTAERFLRENGANL
ncbi:helix-turn-helix domain-containing protein [Acetobacteraceae bacterium]|nr:helix-turn-helix domain-containing protein [Acetobacteraceae bacterium]